MTMAFSFVKCKILTVLLLACLAPVVILTHGVVCISSRISRAKGLVTLTHIKILTRATFLD